MLSPGEERGEGGIHPFVTCHIVNRFDHLPHIHPFRKGVLTFLIPLGGGGDP